MRSCHRHILLHSSEMESSDNTSNEQCVWNGVAAAITSQWPSTTEHFFALESPAKFGLNQTSSNSFLLLVTLFLSRLRNSKWAFTRRVKSERLGVHVKIRQRLLSHTALVWRRDTEKAIDTQRNENVVLSKLGPGVQQNENKIFIHYLFIHLAYSMFGPRDSFRKTQRTCLDDMVATMSRWKFGGGILVQAYFLRWRELSWASGEFQYIGDLPD